MLLILFLLQVYILQAGRPHRDVVEKFMRQRRGVDPRPAYLGVQIRRFQRWSLLLLCLVSVLCVRISSLQAEEATIERCTEYFTQILETQHMRQILQHGANEMMKRYDNGNLTKKELDNTLHVWYITESRLREKVTEIYDIAYAEKCFDSIGTKEKR